MAVTRFKRPVSRKKYRIRRYKRTRKTVRKRGMLASIPRGVKAYPQMRLVRHRYVDNIAMPAASAAGFPSLYWFRANSVFDPDYTGTGHQPLYHDEMAAVYNFYTVIAAFIRVVFDQNQSEQITHGVILSDDATLPNNPNTLLEQEGYKIPVRPNLLSRPVVSRASFNCQKEFKINYRQLMADPGHKNLTGTNPGTDVTRYFGIYRLPVNSGVTLAGDNVSVELIQVCQWREPNDAVGS